MAHRGVSVKTLKRMLKKKGLKTTGRKAALTRRAKKAKLVKGGGPRCVGMNGFDMGCAPAQGCGMSATVEDPNCKAPKAWSLW